jgi:hypothetical protein
MTCIRVGMKMPTPGVSTFLAEGNNQNQSECGNFSAVFSHWLGFVSGRDFSRAEKSPQEFWALALALYSSPNSFPLPDRYSNRIFPLLSQPILLFRLGFAIAGAKAQFFPGLFGANEVAP